jgi:hypothetical protein
MFGYIGQHGLKLSAIGPAAGLVVLVFDYDDPTLASAKSRNCSI